MNTPSPKLKTYAIDLLATVYATMHGQTAAFDQWTPGGQIKAKRAAKAIRAAERAYPGRTVRARLITGQFSGGAR